MNGSQSSSVSDVASFGPFRLFVTRRLLKKGNDRCNLGSRALDILMLLVERAGETVTRNELISRVWPNTTVETANLRVHIAGLRKALEDGLGDTRYIANVAGHGYCFVAPVSWSTTSAVATVPAQHSNLPTRLARMIGRDDTVRELLAQLITSRFVTIVGSGGMGKTTTAVTVAHSIQSNFEGQVYFVDLTGLNDGNLLPTAIASVLGLAVQASYPVSSLLAFLRDRKTLIVLDNCEHMIEAAAMLAEGVIGDTSETHILATSREALRAEGEHVHLLRALDHPSRDEGITAADALAFPAVQLFMERAAASGNRFELNDDDAPVVAGICRRLDGIPLAIELVASRVGFHGVRGTADLLDNRFNLLWHGRRMALPRHQTLNALLDWSFNLLSEQDRRTLCKLAIFVGVFTLDAARFVAVDSEADRANLAGSIDSLAAKSMVSASLIDGTTYYRLMGTTRAYAIGKLSERAGFGDIAARHAIYFAQCLGNDTVVQSTCGGHDLSGYTRYLGDIRAGLEWAFSDHGKPEIGVELAAAAAPLFVGLSLLGECQKWCEQALAVMGAPHRATRHEMALQEARAISSMFSTGNGDQVRGAIERALTLARELGDRDNQLRLLFGLNMFLTRVGDFSGALSVAKEGAELADAAEAPIGRLVADWTLGVSYHLSGDQAAAQRYCEAGIIRAAELGRHSITCFGYDQRIRALVALARALWLRGFSDQSKRIANQAIDESADCDNPISVCISLIYTTSIFLWCGDLVRADDLVTQLSIYAERYSLEPYNAVGVAFKGELTTRRGDQTEGLSLLRTALQTLHSERHTILATRFAGVLATGLRNLGKNHEAMATINGALKQAAQSGATFDLPELLRIKGQILAEAPAARIEAIGCLNRSLAIAREQSALAWELRSAGTLAQLQRNTDEGDRARKQLAAIYGQFTEGFETPDLQNARGLLSELE
ncbi:winged helix-turn-helix domain-containing protein [Bradyrhizobium sp. Tv2a-2]|uniref:ATP-binding protein n=1 Tax=Bradyrhizobium sp. Tv2a-2 TaxID=113395 RepID=UPI0004665D0A|nr:winged helix-turn-helix domain-containing protein [Bradyrhizobium sp. Tv2a-2]